MSEASEQNTEREAAYEEFRQYLTRMIRDFDAAGLTGKPEQQAQVPASETGTSQRFDDQRRDLVPSLGGGPEGPAVCEQEPADQGRTGNYVSAELKAIQDELMVEIREAYQAVDEFISSAGTLPDRGPQSDQPGGASGLQLDELSSSVSRLHQEVLEDLRAAVRQQEGLNRIFGDLLHLQQESQAELHRIVDELELKAVAIEDYLGRS